MIHRLQTDITVDRPLDDVFAIFADARNLESLTPPELRFEIRTPLPIEMRPGALIEYRIRLFGISFSWLTEIACWEPGIRFVDRQRVGPFRVWIHEHRFESIGAESTRIQDEVQYALPLEPAARLVHPLVRSRLDRIFAYREAKVRALLERPNSEASHPALALVPPRSAQQRS